MTLRTRFMAYLLMLWFSCGTVYADVIYLKDGGVLLVDKAWEEGEEVKYTSNKGIATVPKSLVLRLVREQETPAPPPAQRWGIGVSQGRPGAEGSPSASSGPAGGSAISKEALSRLRGNLKANPSDKRAKVELAHALNSVAALETAQGELKSAQMDLEEALRLDGRNPVISSNLAMIHLRLGNYRAAEELLLTSLESDNKNQRVYSLLGEAYYQQEKLSEAIRQWKAGLELGPNEQISEWLEKARREADAHGELAVLQSAHFILRYNEKVSDYRLGQELLGTLEDLYNQLSRELTPQAPATVAVILYPDQTYFDITQAPGWTGALFDGKIRVPTRGLTAVTGRLRAILAHELSHSFIASLPGRGSPMWFLEGVAQLQEGKSAANARKMLSQLQREKHLTPLTNLRDSFMGFSSDMAGIAYAESLSAVEYLTSQFGTLAIRNLLDLMGQNYNFENAFKTAFQRSVAEFETAWQQDLTQ
jgi:tetratricopeptide (TPR) repeat protein